VRPSLSGDLLADGGEALTLFRDVTSACEGSVITVPGFFFLCENEGIGVRDTTDAERGGSARGSDTLACLLLCSDLQSAMQLTITMLWQELCEKGV
jgi:hypothetical protein